MSIKSRNSLKLEFVAGTAATQDKFEDVFDSHYNRYEDSVLMGPIGVTGVNGLIGPSGPLSYSGIWYDDITDAPITLSATGSTGQFAINGSGLWVCIAQNTWQFISATATQGPTGATGSGSAENFVLEALTGGPTGWMEFVNTGGTIQDSSNWDVYRLKGWVNFPIGASSVTSLGIGKIVLGATSDTLKITANRSVIYASDTDLVKVQTNFGGISLVTLNTGFVDHATSMISVNNTLTTSDENYMFATISTGYYSGLPFECEAYIDLEISVSAGTTATYTA